MSGIGFQKLNGAGTAAQAQLDALNNIRASIQNIQSPDLKSWFKILFPDLPVIPFYKTYSFYGDCTELFTVNLLGKTVFGIVEMTCRQMGVAESDNATNGVMFSASLDGAPVYSILNGYHGDDILPMKSTQGKFTGVLDGFANQALYDIGQAQTFAVVRGFVIPDDYDISQLQELDPLPVNNSVDYSITPIVHGTNRLTTVQIPDGINYINLDLAGNDDFELYYLEGANFLTPGVDYDREETGGFTLTGFAPLVYGQTLIIIF